MRKKIVYHGRQIESDEITFIKEFIANNPDKSRWYISRQLCREWNWRQANGALKDMLCRGLLLKLESEGLITLPARKRIPNNPFLNRKAPEPIQIDRRPIVGTVKEMHPLEFRSVRRTKFEKLYNSLIQEYHYLGYTHHVGEHFKYIVFYKDRPLGCIGWTSAARHIGCRDRFIGWDAQMRQRNLHHIAYNNRVLILPWIQVKCLASYVLGKSTRIIPRAWHNFYKHPLYFVETFIDTSKFSGTSYRAANWILIGNTTGRGKNDQTHKPNRPIKAVWGYPLTKNFRRKLCSGDT
jgi:hypothetical protein